MKFQQYIQPIGECGIAFGADDKIITAGHVIKEINAPKFRFGTTMFLTESYVFHQSDTALKDGSEIDLSMYKSGIKSPLKLHLSDIIPGTEVECHTWKRKGNEFEYSVVSGVIDEIYGNFFSCKMRDAILYEGNSGSPLLVGDKVIGVLHGGIDGTAICVFQKILPFMI